MKELVCKIAVMLLVTTCAMLAQTSCCF